MFEECLCKGFKAEAVNSSLPVFVCFCRRLLLLVAMVMSVNGGGQIGDPVV